MMTMKEWKTVKVQYIMLLPTLVWAINLSNNGKHDRIQQHVDTGKLIKCILEANVDTAFCLFWHSLLLDTIMCLTW